MYSIRGQKELEWVPRSLEVLFTKYGESVRRRKGTTIAKMGNEKNSFFERFLLIKYKPDDSDEVRSGVGGIWETRNCPALTADHSGVTWFGYVLPSVT